MKGKKGCLIVLMLLLPVHAGSASADDARFTNAGSWLTLPHKGGSPVNIVVSPFSQAPDSKKYEAENGLLKETIQCNIAARPLGVVNNYFAYTELRWTNPDGIPLADLKTACQIKYRYKVKVSGGAVSGPYMRLTSSWENGWVNPSFQAWNADGDWHEMVQPLQPVDKADWHPEPYYDWQSEVTSFQLNILLSVPKINDQILVTVYLSDFELVNKDTATPAYLVVYDDNAGQNWQCTAPDLTLAGKINEWGYKAHQAPCDSLTMDLLRQFNLVVLQPSGLNGWPDDSHDVLLQYVREGGGLLVLGTWNGVGQTNENNWEYNSLLEDVGIQILSEQVFEDNTTYKASCPLGLLSIGWTDNIFAGNLNDPDYDAVKAKVVENVTGYY
jgi:hypothetical protein